MSREKRDAELFDRVFMAEYKLLCARYLREMAIDQEAIAERAQEKREESDQHADPELGRRALEAGDFDHLEALKVVRI